MITYFFFVILSTLFNAITSPIRLFPDVSLPSELTAAIASFSLRLWLIANVIPYTLIALFGSLLVIFGIESKILSYKTIKWLYSKIPGVN